MAPEVSTSVGRLERWVRALGGRLGPIEIRRLRGGGRGVFARSRIEAGTLLMEIPAHSILTAFHTEALSILLLTARKAAHSFWRPYCATLPKRFPSLPLFFPPEDRAYLKGSHTLKLVEMQERQFAGDYEALGGAFGGGGAPFTYEEFLWARAAVLTRGFSLRIRDVGFRALVPLAHLMDHRIPPEASYGFEQNGCFRVTAKREIAAGAPIYLSYGTSSNSRLLVHYGFALADNPHNEARISAPELTVPRGSVALLNMLRGRAGGEDGSFLLTGELGSAEGVLSFLRAACASADEPVRLTGTRVAPFSSRNEARALGTLRQACLEALAAFDGTLAQDEALLAGGRLTTNQRHAVIVRRGEKQALQTYVDLADAVLPLLLRPGFEMARLAGSAPSSLARFAPYLRTLGEGGTTADKSVTKGLQKPEEEPDGC